MTTCPDNWREGDLCFDFSSAETVIKLDLKFKTCKHP